MASSNIISRRKYPISMDIPSLIYSEEKEKMIINPEYAALYRKFTSDYQKKRHSKYHAKNKDKHSEYHKRHNAEKRREVLLHYSNSIDIQCICCETKVMDFLTLDHIDGGGRQHRKNTTNSTVNYLHSLHEQTGKWLEGFQVMCMNCNWYKHLNGECSVENHSNIILEVKA